MTLTYKPLPKLDFPSSVLNVRLADVVWHSLKVDIKREHKIFFKKSNRKIFNEECFDKEFYGKEMLLNLLMYGRIVSFCFPEF